MAKDVGSRGASEREEQFCIEGRLVFLSCCAIALLAAVTRSRRCETVAATTTTTTQKRKEDEKKLINPRQQRVTASQRSHRPEAHLRSLNPLAYEVLNTVAGGKRKKRYKGRRGGRQKQ